MNKLEIGMYVRTKKYGIAKIIGGISDKFNIDVFKKDGCTLRCQKEKDILKASFNIIDLIEEGDYVNGYKVLNVLDFIDNSKMLSLEKIYDSNIANEDIKSIVTKEQFEGMQYVIK